MDRISRWLWTHRRRHFALAMVLTSIGSTFVIVVVPALIVLAVMFELSASRTVALFATVIPAALVVSIGGVYLVQRPRIEQVRRWARGDTSDPVALWTSLCDISRASRVGFLPLGTAAAVPLMAYVVFGVIGESWAAFVAVLIGMIGVLLAATVIVTVSFDDLTRPLCEEIDEFVSACPGSDARLSVRARVTATNALIGWGTGFVTAATAVQFQSHAGQLGSAAVASLAFGISFAVLIASPMGVRPILRPLDDLLQGTKRVAAGQFTHRVTRTSDDEFGDLIASFNQMQQGLLERERLQSAFGSYVDPALAQRLLTQSHDLFTGEEVTVTVFFADVRDFTPFAERATPREAVERLNALFELVVLVLREHHGHANKFLGDGVLAVFGAPEISDQHADDAIAAAQAIQDKVRSTFGDSLRVGIGINTGQVIAGTVGGGGKLEFTLIGDAVNVAARVEQMTKTTGDQILLTQATLDAATRAAPAVIARGEHELKGKAVATALYALM